MISSPNQDLNIPGTLLKELPTDLVACEILDTHAWARSCSSPPSALLEAIEVWCLHRDSEKTGCEIQAMVPSIAGGQTRAERGPAPLGPGLLQPYVVLEPPCEAGLNSVKHSSVLRTD